MSDLISRQAAMEEISKQQTYKMFEGEDTLYFDANDVGSVLASLPSAQPELAQNLHNACTDLISRQTAIELIERMKPYHQEADDIAEMIANMPSAQPERLTDDDFETIRIHLNAYKEKLCNQRRWKEAEEYERLIARFMAFAPVQQEIVRCEDCAKCQIDTVFHDYWCDGRKVWKNHYCGYAERRTDD